MATANKTRDLKRKLELANALAAANNMVDNPIHNRLPQTSGKPKILIPKGFKRPVGEHSSKHATQIGVIIRLESPMQVEGWAKISDEIKDHLFRKLINKLSYDVEEPHVVHCIWMSFARQYFTFLLNALKYYQKMKAEGGVALARQNVYSKLANRRDDWLWLCDFWET
ncbi:hypothetical protein CDL12_00520 [Handroanthus impetiginosus]|uniref:Uncharacterized protein n=1 Tax=Handroanthus impetiginosus TaxID=429701 RepID=A0A2G9IAD6_9LAMI|nr:hypothetical protein CDL12_00520 [Handroanthus impetiginosus]